MSAPPESKVAEGVEGAVCLHPAVRMIAIPARKIRGKVLLSGRETRQFIGEFAAAANEHGLLAFSIFRAVFHLESRSDSLSQIGPPI